MKIGQQRMPVSPGIGSDQAYLGTSGYSPRPGA